MPTSNPDTAPSQPPEPLYPLETALYLGDLPRQDPLGTHVELSRLAVTSLSQRIEQILAANREAERLIEVQRKAIAWRTSVLAALAEGYPDRFAELPEHVRVDVNNQTNRLQPE